jgi:hypothetical protein
MWKIARVALPFMAVIPAYLNKPGFCDAPKVNLRVPVTTLSSMMMQSKIPVECLKIDRANGDPPYVGVIVIDGHGSYHWPALLVSEYKELHQKSLKTVDWEDNSSVASGVLALFEAMESLVLNKSS